MLGNLLIPFPTWYPKLKHYEVILRENFRLSRAQIQDLKLRVYLEQKKIFQNFKVEIQMRPLTLVIVTQQPLIYLMLVLRQMYYILRITQN